MSHERDEAVVLRLTEFSESSQIVTLFTRTAGHTRLIAKGARRSTKKRFAAGLDVLEHGTVQYLPPRGDAQLGTLTEWVQRDTFTGLRRDLLRLQIAWYAVELVAALTEPGDAHWTLYDGLLKLLRDLADEADAPRALVIFQATLLEAIGYAPNVDTCVVSQRPLTPHSPVYFSSEAGGMVSRDYEASYVEKRRVPAGLIGTTPATGPPEAWFDLLDYHLTHIAGKRFKTADGLARLLRQRPR
jgi:DNA repair protein RecO (recombination protein O)